MPEPHTRRRPEPSAPARMKTVADASNGQPGGKKRVRDQFSAWVGENPSAKKARASAERVAKSDPRNIKAKRRAELVITTAAAAKASGRKLPPPPPKL